MTTTRNLLVELFVEELPPKSLKLLGESFAAGLHKRLSERGFVGDSIKPVIFATPRRLGAWFPGCAGDCGGYANLRGDHAHGNRV